MVAHDGEVRLNDGTWRDLLQADRAVVFVFSPGCEISRANMANWTEIIRSGQGSGVSFFAVGPVDAASAMEYWGPLAKHIRIIASDPSGLNKALGVDTTPVTLVIARGRIRSKAEGPLRIAALEQLRSVVRGSSEENDF